MPKETVGLKIPKKQGEKAIKLAVKIGLFNNVFKVERDDEHLYIPLFREPAYQEWAILRSEIKDAEIKIRNFTEKESSSISLIESLEDKMPNYLLESLPQSFDIIGDIVIVEIPSELKKYQNLIGEAILQTHKNIKTVLAKAGDIKGVYRVRDYTFLAGENKTKTIHREFGCQYYVDVAKAYFSPRLSHEHERVASLVQAGEVVVDLFSGVGPFSVLIGKNKPQAKVYAVDLNPEAVELLNANVKINRVENRVFPILGDAREVAQTKLKGVADRVIMNLPEMAIELLDAACQTLKPEGGTVHFYAFIRAPNTIENLKQTFIQQIEKCSRKVVTFDFSRSIRETAPYESQVVLDVKIT